MVSFEENDCSESQATFVIEDEELNYVEGAWIQNMRLKCKKMKKVQFYENIFQNILYSYKMNILFLYTIFI